MTAAGLRLRRVDADKVSSDLYLNARGLAFTGDWRDTADALANYL